MTSSKICRKCEETKAIIDFYEHPKMADGHLNICKECTKKRVGEHRTKNIEQIREYDRTRGKEKERMATSAIISKRWAKRDSRIMSAHSKVSRAIRSGLLEKKSCVICGTTKSYAHHESYNRPLDVVWYCQVHHKARHKEMALAGIDPLLLIDEENN